MLLSPLFIKGKKPFISTTPLSDKEIQQLERSEKEYRWLGIGISLAILGAVVMGTVPYVAPLEHTYTQKVYEVSHTIRKQNNTDYTINNWRLSSEMVGQCQSNQIIQTLASLKGKPVMFVINERFLDTLEAIKDAETKQDIHWC